MESIRTERLPAIYAEKGPSRVDLTVVDVAGGYESMENGGVAVNRCFLGFKDIMQLMAY